MIIDIGTITPLSLSDTNSAGTQNLGLTAPTAEQLERFQNAMAETKNMTAQIEAASSEMHLLLENISGTLLKDQVLKIGRAHV